MKFKDKRITSESQPESSETGSSETSETATFTMPKDALTKPESVKYGVGCIVCGELTATAPQASYLPQFTMCDKCKKAIIKVRKMLEEE